MVRVLCIGVFDMIHDGHRNYFKQAREHGDVTVVVAHDKNVLNDKGKRPRHSQQERIALVEQEPLVDDVHGGYPDDKLRIVEELEPDVILLGYDSTANEERLKQALAQRGLHPEIIRATAYKPELYKTSLLN